MALFTTYSVYTLSRWLYLKKGSFTSVLAMLLLLFGPRFLAAQSASDLEVIAMADSLLNNHRDYSTAFDLLSDFTESAAQEDRVAIQPLLQLLEIEIASHRFADGLNRIERLEKISAFGTKDLQYQLNYKKIIIYILVGRYDQAIIRSKAMIEQVASERIPSPEQLSALYNTLGVSYLFLDLDNAEDCYLRSIAYSRQMGDFKYSAYNNLIDFYILDLNYKAAGAYIDTLSNQAWMDKDYLNQISVKNKRAHLFTKIDRAKEAKKLIYENRRFMKERGMQRVVSDLIYESYVYHANGQLDSAILIAQRVLDDALQNKEIELTEVCLTHLADVYTEAGDYEDAVSIYQQYLDLEKSQNKANQLEVINQTTDRDLQTIKAQRESNFWGILIVALIGGISLVGYLWMKKRREKEAHLRNEKIQEDLRKQLQIKTELLVKTNLARQQSLQFLSQLKKEIRSLGQNRAKLSKQVNQLINKINSTVDFHDRWDKINQYIQELYPGFLSQLRQEYPQLTDTEVRHCIFYKLNLTTEEIATILHIEPNSVNSARYRLKKKIDIHRLLEAL